MSKENNYTKENIQTVAWNELIRKRPGMYIGHVNAKGFIEMLQVIFSSAIVNIQTTSFLIEIKDKFEAKIRFNNLKCEIENNWGQFKTHPIYSSPIEMFALNALSEKFRISFLNTNNEKVGEEYFEKGVLISGQKIEKIECSIIEVEFSLDESIWGKDFKWNKIYMTHSLREFAYLYKRAKFELKYKEDEENCRVVYHFKNGLKDKIDIEILDGLGGSYFETEIDENIGFFHIEAAFAFREYSVDAPYLKSYVNDFLTFENGTHVDGLLKGLTYGVMKYFQKYELTEVYKISEKGMRANLVAAINIRLKGANFSGCVRNKLASSEIIEPIANHVAQLLFEKIEANEEATKQLVRKFKI